jgi:hypothetical protein
MNDDDFTKVWCELVLPALSTDDQKRLVKALLSSAIISEMLAKNEYHEGDAETAQENHKAFKEIVSKIKHRYEIGD